MSTLPWTLATQPSQGSDALVLGSCLTLGSYRHTLGFLRAAMKVRRQVLDSPGAIGMSLIAQPMRTTYWTLSVWEDQTALDSFVGSSPHSEVLQQFRRRLTSSSFTTWSTPAADLPARRSNAKKLWQEAKQRLSTPAAPNEA